MLELYYFPISRCSKKVKMALIEKDIPHKTNLVNLWSYDQMKPDFLRLNPHGLVPVLIHDEKVVTESDYIVDYIDKNFEGNINLVPEDEKARSEMWEWVNLQNNYPKLSWRTLAMNKKFPFPDNLMHSWLQKNYSKKVDFIQKQLKKHSIENEFYSYYQAKLDEASNIEETLFDEHQKQVVIYKIEEALDKVEFQIARTQWLLGDFFSLADIVWLSVLDRLEDVQMECLWEDGRRPSIEKYLGRLHARPSYKEAFERPFKAVPWYILLSFFA